VGDDKVGHFSAAQCTIATELNLRHFQVVIHEALMLLQETCRPAAAETDSADVGMHDATVTGASSSNISDATQRFISAVSGNKLLGKPSYIDVVKPRTEIKTDNV